MVFAETIAVGIFHLSEVLVDQGKRCSERPQLGSLGDRNAMRIMYASAAALVAAAQLRLRLIIN